MSVLFRYLYIYNKIGNATLSNKRYKKISDCIKELENRKKIFDVYSNALMQASDFEKIKEKVYRYWIVFYVRQRHSLKYEYILWDKNDLYKWDNLINKDSYIKTSLDTVSQKYIKRYSKKYEISFLLKRTVKKLLKI